MEGKVRSAAAGLGYAVVGAVVLGSVGVVITILVDADAGLEGVGNAVIVGGIGVLGGAILGVVVFVWGGKALEQQQQREQRRRESAGSNR